jgi:dihydrofolate synthase/folylpolyglutamate synthase
VTGLPPAESRGPATEFLFSLERFGMKFGLANMAALCAALGHPERAFPSILIAGTNGKGSVAAMADTALRAAGLRSARYTSPHLQRLTERFVIDGREVEAGRLESSAGRVREAVEHLIASGTLEALPTFFESTTAVAFDLFRDARVDVAVLEVGLGGRLDATNVVTPIATAIVSIDFDHQAQLGDTLASIAAEKAGIIKPGVPVVCGAMPAEAMAVIERIASERGAPLLRAGGDRPLADRIAALPLALAGEHQRANAAVALRLLETVDADRRHAVRVGEAARIAGLTEVRWPGRLEAIARHGRPVLLDAAHNPAGARALASYLSMHAPGGAALVFGAMKDKAVAEMLRALAPAARVLVCTTAPTPRAMTADELVEIAAGLGLAAAAIADPMDAIDEAAKTPYPVIVAGSIFLIGAVRERITRTSDSA